jgi:hypothetical protein
LFRNFKIVKEDKSTDDNANNLEFSQMLWARRARDRLLHAAAAAAAAERFGFQLLVPTSAVPLPKGERWVIYFSLKLPISPPLDYCTAQQMAFRLYTRNVMSPGFFAFACRASALCPHHTY